MDTHTLSTIVDMILRLGEGSKEAFIWYLAVQFLVPSTFTFISVLCGIGAFKYLLRVWSKSTAIASRMQYKTDDIVRKWDRAVKAAHHWGYLSHLYLSDDEKFESLLKAINEIQVNKDKLATSEEQMQQARRKISLLEKQLETVTTHRDSLIAEKHLQTYNTK